MRKTWIQLALVSAIALAAIASVVGVAIVGISSIGESAFAESATLGYANATMWNTVASIGPLPMTVIVIGVVLLLLALTGVAAIRGFGE